MAKSDVLVRMKADTQSYDASIAKARRTLEGFRQENLSLGGVIGQVTKSFTAYAAGIASISALAGKLSSVVSESVDLARAGEGVRQAFDRLNRPDLLDNLRQATHGTVNDIELMKQAVKFDNFKLSLDDMGAMLAFAQQKAKDTGESIDYMVNSITTGLGRQSKQILDNLGISAAELTQRMSEGKDMTQAVADIIREEMAKAGDYIETASDRAARATAENQNRLEELGREIMPVAETFNSAWKEIELGGLKLLNKVLVPLANSLSSLRKLWNEGKVDWNITPKNGIPNLADDNVDDNGNFIKKPKNGSGMITWSSVSNIDEVVVSGTKPKKTKKTTSGTKTTKTEQTELQLNQKKINDLTNEYVKLGDNATETAKKRQEEIQKEIQLLIQRNNLLNIRAENAQGKLKGGEVGTEGLVKVDSLLYNDIVPSIDQIRNYLEKNPIKIPVEAASDKIKGIMKTASITADVVGSIGDAFNAIEDPAAKVAGTIAQAIASVALGYATATSKAGSMGPWAWVAFAATGLAEMLTMISTIHSATGYASGGIVGGNSFSGDNVPAMVGNTVVGLNAGELILNKSQQNNIASQLTQAGGGGRLVAKLRGRDILISLERELSETGKGQLATWR
jgi:hypothetical protein